MKSTLIVFLVFLLSIGSDNPPIAANEILWDTWGIPHIYATSDAELYKMMGWAQMKNHGDLVLKLYGEARGQSAEYWEGDAKRDEQLHRLGLVENSANLYDSLGASDKVIVDAFAKGLNAYATKHSDQLDDKYEVVLPIKPTDVIAHSFRVFYYEFLISRQMGQTANWTPGSNAWAINGTKTISGNSMLLANPHLPWEDFWLFFEAHLITEDNDLYGATLVGMPTIGIGFNKYMGWTHTVNTIDNVDVYEIDVKDGQYKVDDQWHAFESKTIKYGDKELTRKTCTYGIIIQEANDKALAIRFPNMDGSMNIFKQWSAMGKAKSLEEFQVAIEINAIPLFNIIYADKDQNILYHFGGNVPKKKGNWDRWQGIVSTSSSADIWNEYYDYDAVPSYINPEGEWIQNANDPPYTSTVPSTIQYEDYPNHIAPNSMSFRPQRSATLIKNAAPQTLESFIELKHDTKSQMAIRLRDDLAELESMTEDVITLEALKVLADWDGSFDADSKGAVLFTNIIFATNGNSIFQEKWDYNNPLTTPDGFKDPQQVLAMIKGAASKLKATAGAIDVPYGQVFRLKVGEHEYPGNGGFGQLGIFRTMNYTPTEDGRYYAFHGDTFVCATEFGSEITAKAVMGYGNATQTGNKHVGDQLKLYHEKALRDVWISRDSQESNLELTEYLKDMQ